MSYKVNTIIHFGKPKEDKKKTENIGFPESIFNIDKILSNNKLTDYQKRYIIDNIIPRIYQEVKDKFFNNIGKEIIIDKYVKIPKDNKIVRIQINIDV